MASLLAKLLEMLREATQRFAENRKLCRVLDEIVDRVEHRLEAVEAPTFEVRGQRLAKRLACQERRRRRLAVSLEERARSHASEVLFEEVVGVGK
jgi:hypothetical protein